MEGQNAQGSPSTSSTGASQASAVQGTGTNTISSDLSALNQAIQSNNTTNIQSTFAQLQQDMQTAQGLYSQMANLMGSFGTTQASSGTVNITM